MDPSPILTKRHYTAYVVLCFIWGTTWLAIRLVVRDLPPFYSAGIRFLLAAAILIVPITAQRLKFPQKARQWRAIAILGVTMIGIPYGLLFWAEQRITSSMTALLFSSLPLMVAVLTPFMTGGAVPRRVLGSMVVAVGGLGVLFYGGLSTTPQALLGGAAVLLSVVFSAWSSIFAKIEINEVHPAVGTALQLFVGAIILFTASLWMERSDAVHWTTSSALALLFLATFGSAAAFAIYYWLLKQVLPYQISTITLIVPLVAMAEGALILHEPIPLTMLLAAILVLFAVGCSLLPVGEEIEPVRLS